MEMHQIRYFLAVCNTLNFTRAAEECNVTQPSLTRAIQKLEEELGGPLFRRERSRTHLSDLGMTMLPLLTRSYESAMAAKEQAESLGKAGIARLRIGLSNTVKLEFFLPAIREIEKTLPELEIQLARGTAEEIERLLEQGSIELALTANDKSKWDRIDRWPLFEEDFIVVAAKSGTFGSKDKLSLDELTGERIIWRSHCEQTPRWTEAMKEKNVSFDINHEISMDADLYDLVGEGLGVSLVPRSLYPDNDTIVAIPLIEPHIRRSVALLAVAGRRYTAAGQLMINFLRSADWSRLEA